MLRYNDGKDIRDELFNEQTPQNKIAIVTYQAHILITVGGIPTTVLIDTGAAVNVLSYNLFKQINNVHKLPTFPVQNCKIIGAVGARSRPVKIQAHVPLQFCGETDNCSFLVVESLIEDCILGLEYLQSREAKLDFKDGKCHLTVNQHTCILNLLRKEITSGKSCKSVKLEEASVNQINFENSVDVFENETESFESLAQKVQESTNATESQRQQLLHLLHKYIRVFDKKPGVIKTYQYHMQVKPHEAFCKHTYSIPWAKQPAVKAEINRMLRWNIIEPSLSQYSSPLLAIFKSDGSVRLVLDARAINKIIIPVRTRPENLEEQLQKFFGVKYLSSIDLRSSYWQVPITEESRQYTAFIFSGRSYQFKVLPFGLNVSSGVFITALDTVLGPELLDRITVYVDDILVATATWEEHLILLERVLDRFLSSGVTVNLLKSKFVKTEIKFLGHIISSTGIVPDPEKLKAIQNFPTPHNRRQLKGFYGLCSFFRRFLPQQLLNSTPLLSLLRKDTPWNWSEQCHKDFVKIKEALVNSDILHHPDMTQDFCIATDSSNYGLGACLFQISDKLDPKSLKVISFASRTLTECERRYSTTELELLAIVWAFKKFHHYVFGKHTKVFCDHQALSFLMSCKLLHNRLARWAMILQEYDFEIEHIKGTDNVIADALSRLPQGMPDLQDCVESSTEFKIMLMKDSEYRPYYLDMCRNIQQLQQADDRWHKVITKITENPDTPFSQHYKLHNGVLFFRRHPQSRQWCVCIPGSHEVTLIWHTHRVWGHFGPLKCLRKLKQYCHFPNMSRKIHNTLKSCLICQRCKPNNQSSKMPLHSILPYQPLHLVSIDTTGQLPIGRGGVRHILGLYDVFSKFVKLYALKTTTATAVIRRLERDYFPFVGKPVAILSDNAKTFTCQTWKNFIRNHDIKHILISRYNPSANPMERMFRELNRFMRTYTANKQTRWIEYIGLFEQVVNNLPLYSTPYTPTDLVLQHRESNEWVKPLPKIPRGETTLEEKVRQVLVALTDAAFKRKAYYDKQLKRTQTFRVGDYVMLRNQAKPSAALKRIKKWQYMYTGPFRIVKIPHEGSYLLSAVHSEKIRGLYPHKHLKKFYKKIPS